MKNIVSRLFLFFIPIVALFLSQCSTPEVPDNILPECVILYPVSGEAVSGTVKIVVGASDNDALDHVSIFIDGDRAASLTQAPYEYQWDTSPVADNHHHTIQAVSVDKSGNAGFSGPITVRVVSGVVPDTLAPVISLLYPVSGSTIQDTVVVIPQVVDDNSIAKVEYFVDGYLTHTVTQSPFEFDWDVSNYIDGSSHAIFARAYDQNNNIGYSNVVTVSVHSNNVQDNTPPTVSLLYPTGSATVSDTVQVMAEASDNLALQRLEFYVDGQKHSILTQAPWQFTWDVSNYIDGSQHSIFIIAFDTNQNQATSAIVTVTVSSNNVDDTTPPDILISYPPNGLVLTGNITVVATATDNVGVSNVEFYIDGALAGNDVTSPYEFPWDISSLTPGSAHTLFARAYDGAGNSTQTPLQTINIGLPDVTPPSVQFIYPTAGNTITQNATISVQASDDVGVSQVEFYIDGELVGTDPSQPYTYDWDITGYPNNSVHTLFARAYDAAGNAGNTAVITVTVINVDDTPPVVTILYPTSGSQFTAGDTVSVVADVQDNVGVERVEFYIDGELKSTVTAAPYQFAWDTSAYGDGRSHSIYVKGYDAAGNSNASLITVVVLP